MIWIRFWNDLGVNPRKKSPFPNETIGFVWKLWENSIPLVDYHFPYSNCHLDPFGGILYTHCLKTLKILIDDRPT